MTTFRHDDTSPLEADWLASPLSDTETIEPPSETDRLLVLAAHPDDETLGAGGLIARAYERGTLVTVVVATDGEASHPMSPTHSSEELARRRRSEVQDAVLRLAPGATVHFLGLPDGHLAEFGEALAAQVEYFAQTATHVVCPWEGDRHPDHAACARAATQAAGQHRLVCWQYPIWAWHWADPASDELPWRSMRRLSLTARDQLAKRRAIGCHVSQHSPLSDRPGDEPIILPEMLAHFERPFETFVLAPVGDAIAPGYFDRLYADSDDPWELGTRFYEQRKRALLLASLPRARFARAFEPGCATGLITAQLAQRCDQVVAWDVADSALEQTARRLADASHARVERGAIPEQWPEGEFDLLVISEVGYYCTDLELLAQRVWDKLTADGVLVACHWRHPADDHRHSADAVHSALGRHHLRIVTHIEADFRLEVWTRSGRSVAVETGVVA
ncbi:MAG TPA: bifunctional PIG-L family deacetylase/class I SAM-dependent methyltransferase [Jatrophihabitans sp.]|jgi:LmbE family N-acetylglucosaminyl deacetylase